MLKCSGFVCDFFFFFEVIELYFPVLVSFGFALDTVVCFAASSLLRVFICACVCLILECTVASFTIFNTFKSCKPSYFQTCPGYILKVTEMTLWNRVG